MVSSLLQSQMAAKSTVMCIQYTRFSGLQTFLFVRKDYFLSIFLKIFFKHLNKSFFFSLFYRIISMNGVVIIEYTTNIRKQTPIHTMLTEVSFSRIAVGFYAVNTPMLLKKERPSVLKTYCKIQSSASRRSNFHLKSLE